MPGWKDFAVMKMKEWVFAMLGLVLLGSGFATNMSTLELKNEIMACRVNAVVSLVNYGENSTNISSDGIAEKLQDDLITLGAFAANGDRLGFNEYVRGTLKEDLRDAVLYLKDVRKELVSRNHSGKPPAIEYFNQVVGERSACIQAAALAFAQGDLANIEARVEKMDKVIENLRNKGVNTNAMEEIAAQAHANLDAYTNAVASGSGENVIDTLNGIREQHLHLWARFHMEKLKAILASVQDEAIAKGYQGDVDSINALLTDVESKTAPGRPYDPGEVEQVKGWLVQATQELRDLIKNVRGA